MARVLKLLLLAALILALGSYAWQRVTGGHTLLQMAAIRGSKAMTGVLLACGADVNAGSSLRSLWYTETVFTPPPLFLAVANGHWDVAGVLLANKADVNSNYIYPLLHQEAKAGRRRGVEWLLAHNANVNVIDDGGQTALHETTSKEMAELLIANKALVNARDQIGRTPLHTAPLLKGVEYSRKDIVEVLLKNKADINARDKNGHTPLDAVVMDIENRIRNMSIYRLWREFDESLKRGEAEIRTLTEIVELLRSRGGKSGKDLGKP